MYKMGDRGDGVKISQNIKEKNKDERYCVFVA